MPGGTASPEIRVVRYILAGEPERLHGNIVWYPTRHHHPVVGIVAIRLIQSKIVSRCLRLELVYQAKPLKKTARGFVDAIRLRA